MIPKLSALGVIVVVGVTVGIPAYSKFLRILRERHIAIYNELGRPTITMGSPSKSIRLQRFLYSKRAIQTGDSELTATARFLRIFTVLLVVIVLACIVLVFSSAWSLLSKGIDK